MLGAIAFYTCVPIPQSWPMTFDGIARFAPLVGVFIGGVLGLMDWGFEKLDMPILTRSALVVCAWVGLTGGLHLDGAMDTADGLAVADPQRRLDVMADSVTGAFGAMVAIALLVLKTAALSDLASHRGLALMTVAGWGRWGQVLAIIQYPYLKPTGKGAFHKAALQSLWDSVPGLVVMLGVTGVQVGLWGWTSGAILGATGGGAIALAVGAWFHHQLGGHTGDTYGAVVEWTEALLLCSLTALC